jgi:predicted enzyme related to lactoylglutathione lyase
MARLPRHAIHWFDIPVTDLDRARRFYDAVLGYGLELHDENPDFPMAVFPVADPGEVSIGGALVKGPGETPGVGATVYLAVDDVDGALSRVENAGGQIQEPAVDTPYGRIAFIIDSEGNRVGLHERE